MLTRTWIWHGPHWCAKVSCGRSWDAHLSQLGELSPPPGIDDTVSTKSKTKTHNSKTLKTQIS